MATVTASYNWVSGETVTPAKLNTTAAPTVVVADNEVTTAKILDANVTTAKILDANVTNAKLATGIDASKLTTGTLPIARVADGAVTTAKIANGTARQILQTNSAGTASEWNNSVMILGDTQLRDLSGQTLHVTGYPLFYQTNGGTATSVFSHTGSGTQNACLFRQGNPAASVGSINMSGGTTTSYNTSSDHRLKTNAQPLAGGLDVVESVNAVTFDWISSGEKGVGFIAHELQAVVPEAVTGEKDAVNTDGSPNYQGVDASKLVPYLVKAIQELSAKIASLEAATK
jgi:hypothetical protein